MKQILACSLRKLRASTGGSKSGFINFGLVEIVCEASTQIAQGSVQQLFYQPRASSSKSSSKFSRHIRGFSDVRSHLHFLRRNTPVLKFQHRAATRRLAPCWRSNTQEQRCPTALDHPYHLRSAARSNTTKSAPYRRSAHHRWPFHAEFPGRSQSSRRSSDGILRFQTRRP